MLSLKNSELALDILDPADPADNARQGWRYCHGGYIYQVTDAKLGPLVSGPAYPNPAPPVFDGQGLPESFRHLSRADNKRFTWKDDVGLAIGAGIIASNPNKGAQGPDSVRLVEAAKWTVNTFADHLVFQTRQAAAGFSYELTRKIELRGRTITSDTQLTNVGDTPLTLEWFPHPFWQLTQNRARLKLPAGTTLADNPGFAVAPDGLLTHKRPFVEQKDSQFSLLTLPAAKPLAVEVDHPKLARVTFAIDYVPADCPVWGNSHTISLEPYLALNLAPGETRHWQVKHGFVV